MDIASLGLAVDSGPVERGAASLQKLTTAAGGAEAAATRLASGTKVAAVSADALAAASDREAAAIARSTSATQVHSRALTVAGSATRQLTAQRANLVFQLQDIGVSLASGMNPLMVAVQQGSQISTIYGQGEGGIGRALSETASMAGRLVTRFWPVAVVVGAASAAIAGMREEINKGNGVTVSFGDTALAVFQVIRDGAWSILKPAVDAIAPWFETAWEKVKNATALTFNFIVGGFVGSFEAIKATFGLLPAALGDLSFRAAQAFLDGINWMVQQALSGINGLLSKINSILPEGAKLGSLGEIAPMSIVNPYAGAASNAAGVAGAAFRKGQGDYASQAMDAIAAQARKNAIERAKEEAKASKDTKSAYDQELESLQKKTAALEIDSKVVGLSTFAAEKLKQTMLLEAAARKDATGLSAARVAQIDAVTTAYARQAAQLQHLKLANDLAFERDQLGRSPVDQAVASRTRGMDPNSPETQRLANLAGINEQLKIASDAGREFTGSLAQGALAGASAVDTLKSALDRLAARALDFAIDQIWAKAFGGLVGAAAGGLGGSFGSVGSSGVGGGINANPGGFGGPRLTAGGLQAPTNMMRPGNDNAPAQARPSLNVNVTNNVGAQITTEQRDDGSIDIRVDRAVARAFDNPTSQASKSLSRNTNAVRKRA